MKQFATKIFSTALLSVIFLNACNDNSNEADPCTNPPEVSVDEVIASVTGKDNGLVVASASKGTSPYQFSIDGSNFQAEGSFSDLAPASYTITVRDVNGCTGTAVAIVREVPEVSYAIRVRPLIDNNCQVSGCHGDNPGLPSWATYDDVKAKAERIKIRTGAKEMPPNNPLADGDIQLIADWVDQGAPNN